MPPPAPAPAAPRDGPDAAAVRAKLEAAGVDVHEREHEVDLDLEALLARQSAPRATSALAQGAATRPPPPNAAREPPRRQEGLDAAVRQLAYAALLWPAARRLLEDAAGCGAVTVGVAEIAGLLCVARAASIAWRHGAGLDRVCALSLAAGYVLAAYLAPTLLVPWAAATCLLGAKVVLQDHNREPRQGILLGLLTLWFIAAPPQAHRLSCP